MKSRRQGPPVNSRPGPRASNPWEIAWATARRPIGALSGILILVLVFGEIFSMAVRRLSTGYPLTTSFVATFVTLIFSANVVNQVITKRLQQRWERIRSIAMQGLNDELRVVRDFLYIIEHGRAPFEVTSPAVAAAEERVPELVLDVMADAIASGQGATMIRTLVCKAVWVPFARGGLAEASAYLRGSLARWSPLLSVGAEVNEASHSMILNSAYLADAVSVLEVPLAEVRLDEGILPANVRSCFVELWAVVAAAFVFVEEESANALRPSLEQPSSLGQPSSKPWQSAMRKRLDLASSSWLKKWECADKSSTLFQRDLLKARDDLKRPQKDLIELTSPGHPEPRALNVERRLNGMMIFRETPTYIVHRAQMMNSHLLGNAMEAGVFSITEWIEVDVRRSADGRLVIFHSERLATGERVGSLAYELLQRLGVRSLEQFIDSLPGKLNVVLDVKNSIDDATRLSSQTTGLLAARAARRISEDRSVLLTSFDPSIVVRTRQDEPSVHVGLTTWQGVPLRESIPTAVAFNLDVLAVHVDSLFPDGIELGDSRAALASQVDLAHQSGLQLACWGGEAMTPADVTYLVEIGIDAIYLDEENLRLLHEHAGPSRHGA
jgi:glycerophosphoryl diester phosphodiesterase